MIRKLLATSCFALLSGGVFAQGIEITADDYQFQAGVTLESVIAKLDNLPVPTHGEDQTWDFSMMEEDRPGGVFEIMTPRWWTRSATPPAPRT